MKFAGYDTEGFYDEMFISGSEPRPEVRKLVERIASFPDGELIKRQRASEKAMKNMGITFNVYGSRQQSEKIWPFDVIPRIIKKTEWDWIDKGLRQRIMALNMFIDDVYHEKLCVRDGIVPLEIIKSASAYRQECEGLNPPGGVWCHITGTDLIRDRDGQMYVLEDNIRCPSGVSYVLENRILMKRTLPMIFDSLQILPVHDYPFVLLEMLQAQGTKTGDKPTVVVLTPGIYNSAYFEHSFLAKQMGVELVEGRDLIIKDGYVYMRTTKGFQKVDVIYRRIDDDFIDPETFRTDSLLGVSGIMNAYRNGNVALVNAPGTGVADDKVIFSYVPDMIRYYLDETPIIPNVPTYLCSKDKDKQHVLENLPNLVVKAANESGGYGMLIGPHSTSDEQKEFADKIRANPRNYIAQPVMSLSRVPVIADNRFEGRHVDLRPFILYCKDIYVLPGGLTRVALKKGSLVVNSSQGGGSKDTWVVT